MTKRRQSWEIYSLLDERDFVNDALILIPAAGYGTRIGSPESKEMLPRPNYDHMIDFVLEVAANARVPAHVITRKEKASLISHLENRRREQPITWQIVEPTREWPESLLLSEPHWRSRNLIILPDSDFSPTSIATEMLESLHFTASAWALFNVPPSEGCSYGVINTTLNRHAEKPKHADGARPWGLFGFRREAGQTLCRNLLESTLESRNGQTKWFDLQQPSKYFDLLHYKDYGYQTRIESASRNE